MYHTQTFFKKEVFWLKIVIMTLSFLLCVIMLAVLSCANALKARIKSTFLVCASTCIAVVATDNNFALRILEIVIFLLIYFSIILGTLYSTPLRDGSMSNIFTLSALIFYVCIFALTIIREVILFPFWENGLFTFAFVVLALFITFSIATSWQDNCAIDDSKFLVSVLECFFVTIFYAGACALIIGLPYSVFYRVQNGHAAETITKSVTAEYELAPDSSGYYLTEQSSDIIGDEYFVFKATDESEPNMLNGKAAKMSKLYTKLHEVNSIAPHVEVITHYYTDIRGKDQVRDYEYVVYVPTGTIAWMK